VCPVALLVLVTLSVLLLDPVPQGSCSTCSRQISGMLTLT
jgi:hypothetical protein